MKLKGTATIQLFDAKTGKETLCIKKHNLVTNAVKNYFNPDKKFTTLSANASANAYNIMANNLPLYTNMYGGIFMFKNPLNEDAESYLLPNDNQIMFRGWNEIASNTDCASRNLTESQKLSNGYKFVWDATTSQCNGTFSSIALTCLASGKSGVEYGVTSGKHYDVYNNFSTNSSGTSNEQKIIGRFYNNSENTGYTYADWKDKKLFPFCMKKSSKTTNDKTEYYESLLMLDLTNCKILSFKIQPRYVRKLSSAGTTDLMQTVPVTVMNDFRLTENLTPAISGNVASITVHKTDEGKFGFYFMYKSVSSSAENRTFVSKHFIISDDGESITEDTAMQKTVITTFDLDNNNTFMYDIVNDRYYYRNTTETYCISSQGTTLAKGGWKNTNCISLFSNNALIACCQKTIPTTSTYDYDEWYFSTFVNYSIVADDEEELGNKLLIFNLVSYSYVYPWSSHTCYSYGLLSPCFVEGLTDKGKHCVIYCHDNYRKGNDLYCQVYNPAYYLGTVYNLSSSVTKTNAQTMKITYELTEEE